MFVLILSSHVLLDLPNGQQEEVGDMCEAEVLLHYLDGDLEQVLALTQTEHVVLCNKVVVAGLRALLFGSEMHFSVVVDPCAAAILATFFNFKFLQCHNDEFI